MITCIKYKIKILPRRMNFKYYGYGTDPTEVFNNKDDKSKYNADGKDLLQKI